jgi:hypothetical protein
VIRAAKSFTVPCPSWLQACSGFRVISLNCRAVLSGEPGIPIALHESIEAPVAPPLLPQPLLSPAVTVDIRH